MNREQPTATGGGERDDPFAFLLQIKPREMAEIIHKLHHRYFPRHIDEIGFYYHRHEKPIIWDKSRLDPFVPSSFYITQKETETPPEILFIMLLPKLERVRICSEEIDETLSREELEATGVL